jgi:hypothetical protein
MRTWRENLGFLRAQFEQQPPSQRDLWHGNLLEEWRPLEDSGLELAPLDPWRAIEAFEPLAQKPRVATDIALVKGSPFERGRYFGDRKLVTVFRSLASAAYQAILGGPFADLTGQVLRADSPRDHSPCWVDVLYLLADRGDSPLLRAPRRENSVMGGDAQNPDTFIGVTYAFLFTDLFTASMAAIDLLLTERTPPADDEQSKRLQIDLQTNTATFDGCTFGDLDPDALQVLDVIWKARGVWVSSEELKALPGLDGARVDRLLKKLPDKLRRLITGATGKGYRRC